MSKAVSTDLTFVEHHPGCGCSPCSQGQPGQPSPLVPVQGTAVASGYEPVDKSGRCGCCSSYYRSVWDRLCQQLFGHLPIGMNSDEQLPDINIWKDGVVMTKDTYPYSFRVMTESGEEIPKPADVVLYKGKYYVIGEVDGE